MEPSSSWLPKRRNELSEKSLGVINRVLDKIPQLPVSVMRIIDMTTDYDVSLQELAEVTMTDPVLSSKILQQVNSAYYGLNRKIDNLRVAVVLLGFDSIRNFAIQSKFLGMLDDTDGYDLYNRKELWIHSYLVSITAESILNITDPREIGVVVTMGLLHDIGKFALYAIGLKMREKGLTSPLFQSIDENTELLTLEERLFGVNHAVIGGMLAQKWNLSERIQSVLEYHHHPSFWGSDQLPEKYKKDIVLINISDFIINQIDGKKRASKEPGEEFFDIIGLKPPAESLYNDTLKQRLDLARDFLKQLY